MRSDACSPLSEQELELLREMIHSLQHIRSSGGLTTRHVPGQGISIGLSRPPTRPGVASVGGSMNSVPVTVVTAARYLPDSGQFQIRTRVVQVAAAEAESDWTDVFVAEPC